VVDPSDPGPAFGSGDEPEEEPETSTVYPFRFRELPDTSTVYLHPRQEYRPTSTVYHMGWEFQQEPETSTVYPVEFHETRDFSPFGRASLQSALDPINDCLAALGRSGGGAGIVLDYMTTDSVDPRGNRPTASVICDYLQGWLDAWSGGSSPPVFPWSEEGYGFRYDDLGWTTRHMPKPPGILTWPASHASWLRLGSNLYVMKNIERNGELFGANTVEADAVGLAWRLLRRSMEQLGDWQDLMIERSLIDDPGFGFVHRDGRSILGAAADIIDDNVDMPVHVILRDALAGPQAGMLTWPDQSTITILRSMGRIANAASAVSQFIAAANLLVGGTGTSGDVIGAGRVVGRRIARLAATLYHEVLHIATRKYFGFYSGVADEWCNGPLVYSGVARTWTYPDDLAAGSGSATKAHYVLSVARAWLESLLVQTDVPLVNFHQACGDDPDYRASN
jgi:hypothetical protein